MESPNTLPTLFVKKLNKGAKCPTMGSKFSAGYDLYSTEDYELTLKEFKLFSTGISLEIPKGYYGRIAPRSGLSCKGIDVKAGVVDNDYRGEVKVLLHNFSNGPYKISKGDKIAQIIITKYTSCTIINTEELKSTERGSDGFGSTGK
jgi:deoxyuridine 5'-triphosphate nucleotidohydrolase